MNKQTVTTIEQLKAMSYGTISLINPQGQTKEVDTDMSDVDALIAKGWKRPTPSANGVKLTFDRIMPINEETKAEYSRIQAERLAGAVGAVPVNIIKKHKAVLETVLSNEQDGQILESGKCVVLGVVPKKAGRKSSKPGATYMAIAVKYEVGGIEYPCNAIGGNELPSEGEILDFQIVTRFESQTRTAFNLVFE